jgi:hypothetical protein
MEELEAMINFATPHWPGLAWATIATVIGQVMAHRVFTEANARRPGRFQWAWWWARKTLPLHPVLAGALLGLMWTNPEGADPAWPRVASAMYFAFFGAMSIWIYQVLKDLLKRKGFDIQLPGDSYPPSDPKENA